MSEMYNIVSFYPVEDAESRLSEFGEGSERLSGLRSYWLRETNNFNDEESEVQLIFVNNIQMQQGHAVDRTFTLGSLYEQYSGYRERIFTISGRTTDKLSNIIKFYKLRNFIEENAKRKRETENAFSSKKQYSLFFICRFEEEYFECTILNFSYQREAGATTNSYVYTLTIAANAVTPNSGAELPLPEASPTLPAPSTAVAETVTEPAEPEKVAPGTKEEVAPEPDSLSQAAEFKVHPCFDVVLWADVKTKIANIYDQATTFVDNVNSPPEKNAPVETLRSKRGSWYDQLLISAVFWEQANRKNEDFYSTTIVSKPYDGQTIASENFTTQDYGFRADPAILLSALEQLTFAYQNANLITGGAAGELNVTDDQRSAYLDLEKEVVEFRDSMESKTDEEYKNINIKILLQYNEVIIYRYKIISCESEQIKAATDVEYRLSQLQGRHTYLRSKYAGVNLNPTPDAPVPEGYNSDEVKELKKLNEVFGNPEEEAAAKESQGAAAELNSGTRDFAGGSAPSSPLATNIKNQARPVAISAIPLSEKPPGQSEVDRRVNAKGAGADIKGKGGEVPSAPNALATPGLTKPASLASKPAGSASWFEDLQRFVGGTDAALYNSVVDTLTAPLEEINKVRNVVAPITAGLSNLSYAARRLVGAYYGFLPNLKSFAFSTVANVRSSIDSLKQTWGTLEDMASSQYWRELGSGWDDIWGGRRASGVYLPTANTIVRPVTIPGGATSAQDIAQRFLGNRNRWPEIVRINGMSDPYRRQDGSYLSTGDPILIPAASGSPSLALPLEGTFGSDLMLQDGDLVSRGGSSFQVVRGHDNFKQSISNRLRTPRGSNKIFPSFGLPKSLNEKQTSTFEGQVVSNIESQVRRDRRIRRIKRLSLREEPTSYVVNLIVELADSTTLAVTLQYRPEV